MLPPESLLMRISGGHKEASSILTVQYRPRPNAGGGGVAGSRPIFNLWRIWTNRKFEMIYHSPSTYRAFVGAAYTLNIYSRVDATDSNRRLKFSQVYRKIDSALSKFNQQFLFNNVYSPGFKWFNANAQEFNLRFRSAVQRTPFQKSTYSSHCCRSGSLFSWPKLKKI